MSCHNSAAIPKKLEDIQGDKRWECLHEEFCHQSRDKEADIIFIGDSLVMQLAQTDEWDKCLAPFHCFNFGIGGDRTEHVLWRIMNGELDNVVTKVVVLWCGTNNHGDTGEQIAEGIIRIADEIIKKQPQCSLVVMSLLPRGRNPNKLRKRNEEANEVVKQKVSERPQMRYLDVTPGFVSSEGTISITDMYDYLHLTRHGYQKITDVLVEELTSLVESS